jgi:hypothetical protein
MCDNNSKENSVALSNSIDALSISEPGKKRHGRGRPHDNKKYKQSCKDQSAPKSQSDSTNNSVLGESQGRNQQPLKLRGKTHRRAAHGNNNGSHQHPTAPHRHNPYVIRPTYADIELSRETAAHWKEMHESVQVDPALQNHLAMMAYAANIFMIEQQQRAFYIQEQSRQNEIAKWLSTKTEAEQKEYLERTQKPLH